MAELRVVHQGVLVEQLHMAGLDVGMARELLGEMERALRLMRAHWRLWALEAEVGRAAY